MSSPLTFIIYMFLSRLLCGTTKVLTYAENLAFRTLTIRSNTYQRRSKSLLNLNGSPFFLQETSPIKHLNPPNKVCLVLQLLPDLPCLPPPQEALHLGCSTTLAHIMSNARRLLPSEVGLNARRYVCFLLLRPNFPSLFKALLRQVSP